MRWSSDGAPLLLHVRCAVIDGGLDELRPVRSYQRDVATAQTFGSIDRQTGRTTVLLTPVEGLKNETVAEFGNAHGHPVINELWSP